MGKMHVEKEALLCKHILYVCIHRYVSSQALLLSNVSCIHFANES